MVLDIAALRLFNQKLLSQNNTKPEDVVSWFGAMQAQDFAAAKWAIAQRLKNHTESDIEDAFNKGHLLRTHIMRPTWHFVTPNDIQWLMALTSARVQRFNGSYYRRSGLDKSIFDKSNQVIRKALAGGKQLTRSELNVKLHERNIPTQNMGLTFTIMQAELESVICSGPRIGKQFTYMLFDERVPKLPSIPYDEALVELTKRYFQSHGPAQLKDFSWWSGLTVTEIKRGISLLGKNIMQHEQNGKLYWYYPVKIENKLPADTAFLIPGFDEYFIAYADRSDILNKNYAKHLNLGGGMINGAVVVNGKMVGGWKRSFQNKLIVVNIKLFENITTEQQKILHNQAKDFGKFHKMEVEVRQTLD